MTDQAGPKILIFDIENMAQLGWTWSNWQTNVIATKQDWYLLCSAFTWVDLETLTWGPIQVDRKAKRKYDDRALAKIIWQQLDDADVVVAHNGARFDVRKMNARFIELGMPPPSPYLVIDTKKVMARVAMNYSNKLDEIARRLDYGRKLDTLGFKTWIGCEENDKESWRLMMEYNVHDVELTAKIFIALLPWQTEVNFSHWSNPDLRPACKHCGSEDMQKRGTKKVPEKYWYTNASKFQLYKCNRCGGWSRRHVRDSAAALR
jgi:hypothetical protein